LQTSTVQRAIVSGEERHEQHWSVTNPGFCVAPIPKNGFVSLRPMVEEPWLSVEAVMPASAEASSSSSALGLAPSSGIRAEAVLVYGFLARSSSSSRTMLE